MSLVDASAHRSENAKSKNSNAPQWKKKNITSLSGMYLYLDIALLKFWVLFNLRDTYLYWAADTLWNPVYFIELKYSFLTHHVKVLNVFNLVSEALRKFERTFLTYYLKVRHFVPLKFDCQFKALNFWGKVSGQ